MKPWRFLLPGALALFLLTRFCSLTSFPIFNDEAIYLQYAQAIHADWAANKFISMDNRYGDWKPPLQYWLAAPFVRLGKDPLLAGRTVAALFSLAGFCGTFLFARELFGEREGALAALLYLLCPPVLFHNDEFIAETFLFSTAPILYWAILRALRPGRIWAWALLAIAAGGALLLFKQAGALGLALAIFLPVARFRGRSQLLRDLLLVIVVAVCAEGMARLILPARWDATRSDFNSHWLLAPNELGRFPLNIWGANLVRVGNYIGAYYSWLVPLFAFAFLGLALWRRNFPELALGAMCLGGAGAVIFLLRDFNEYIFNTAIIAVLLPLLARGFVLFWELRTGWTRAAVVTGAALLLIFWSYQIVLMISAPAHYVARSTPWAVKNYLQSWSTGFGVREVVQLLEKEKRPGVIFVDPQWGNPRTALEVYGRTRFPNLRLIPISAAFFDEAKVRGLREELQAQATPAFVVFSADRFGRRALWQQKVERFLCRSRREIAPAPQQTPLVICSF